jgi:hypothetical protein
MGDFSRKSVQKKQISPIMTSFCLEKARAIPSQAAHYTLDKSRLSLYPIKTSCDALFPCIPCCEYQSYHIKFRKQPKPK